MNDRRTVLRALTAGSLGLLVEGAVPGLARAHAARLTWTPAPTPMPALPAGAAVVFVHGAWADGSNWRKVVPPLQQYGFKVLCAQIPMTTSLSDDVDTVQRWLERTTGPVILVGHAYSGGVIGAVQNDRVKALVYISALAPAEGETVGQVFTRDKPSPFQPKLAPDAHGFIWQPDDGFARAVAPNVSPEEARVLTAVQRPLQVKCIQEKVPTPTWTTTPTWYLIAEEDRMINPATQQFMAGRMKAHTKSLKVDHSAQLSAPQHVVAMVMDAARATIVQQATG
jgi:pimeloyl-ACP methyl ester carboxylesterase